jgi:hypothetical protein
MSVQVCEVSAIVFQVAPVGETISHFSLAIVATPDVLLTIPLALRFLINAIVVPDVDVILPSPDATNTLDAVPTVVAVIEATPRLIFSPIAVLEALALDTALTRLIFSPEQVDATDVAETIVCKSAWSYSFRPYKPVP